MTGSGEVDVVDLCQRRGDGGGVRVGTEVGQGRVTRGLAGGVDRAECRVRRTLVADARLELTQVRADATDRPRMDLLERHRFVAQLAAADAVRRQLRGGVTNAAE